MNDTDDEHKLLDGIVLRQRLENEISSATKSITLISAYVTQSAVDWFLNKLPSQPTTKIICRLLPSDVRSGASQLSALKTALTRGVRVYCLHSLHAKIYCIDDDKIYVGSANLTNNGLMIYGSGNIEANLQVTPTHENLSFIKKILDSATEINPEVIKKMQACIDLKEEKLFYDRWPDGVVQDEEGIWVRDFFWGQPNSTRMSQEHIHDLEILGIDSMDLDFPDLSKYVSNARCVRWLIEKLQEAPDKELYFGSLTQKLHDELKDDPTPYRKNVKVLLQNLLSYCEVFLKGSVEITRPNYSQRIKLITN